MIRGDPPLGPGTPDPDVLTDVLLAPLAPDLYRHQRETLGHGPARIAAALADLARAALRPSTTGGTPTPSDR